MTSTSTSTTTTTTTSSMASAALAAAPSVLSFFFILTASLRVGAGVWNLQRIALIYDAQKPVKSDEGHTSDDGAQQGEDTTKPSTMRGKLATAAIFLGLIAFAYYAYSTVGNEAPHSWQPLNFARQSLPSVVAAAFVYYAALATYKLFINPQPQPASSALCRDKSDKVASSLLGHLRVVKAIDHEERDASVTPRRSIRRICAAIAALAGLLLAVLPQGAFLDYSFFLIGAWACFTTCYDTVHGFSMSVGAFTKRPFRACALFAASVFALGLLFAAVMLALSSRPSSHKTKEGVDDDDDDDDIKFDTTMVHILSLIVAGNYAQSSIILVCLLAIGARFDATAAAIQRGSRTMGISRSIADGILAESRRCCRAVKDAETGESRTPILVAAYNAAGKGKALTLRDLPVLRAGLVVALIFSLAGIKINQCFDSIVYFSDGQPLPMWNFASIAAIPFAVLAMLWAARGAPISLWNYTEDWQPKMIGELDEEAAEVTNLLGGEDVDEKEWLRADWDGEEAEAKW